jgi:hypothetical protein
MKTTSTDLFIAAALSFVAGVVAALSLSDAWSDEAALRHYRAVLIRNGAAEYRPDINGEPVFVITDREITQPK